MVINYKIGNLFDLLPVTPHPIVIPHIVNSWGLWGSGFVVPLGQKWSITKQSYLDWHQQGYDFERNILFALGQSQVIQVKLPTRDVRGSSIGPIFVVNMIGQEGIIGTDNPHPIKYVPLGECMKRVADLVRTLRYSGKDGCDIVEIHAPAFGSLRAGGSWNLIEPLIQQMWVGPGIEINIYTLNEQEQQTLLNSLEKS